MNPHPGPVVMDPTLHLLNAMKHAVEAAEEFVGTVPPLTQQRSVRIQRRLDLWAIRRAGLQETLAQYRAALKSYSEHETAERDAATRRAAAAAARPWWKKLLHRP